MELHEKLLHLRKGRGMTQDEFAEALFVSRQTVYKWETGRALPDVTRLRQICDFYKISADELLETQFSAPTAIATPETVEPGDPTSAAGRRKFPRWAMLVAAAAIMLCVTLPLLITPQEVREAKALGIVPAGMDRRPDSAVTERELVTLLANTASAALGRDCPALTAALNDATSERMTREKAAYWLYCTHVWTVCDPDADMEITHRLPCDPVTQRNVYADLNGMSRAGVDAIPPPWEGTLCRELREVEALFASYDGTARMDEQINAILYGPYYTAVTFCAAQKSFLSARAILENSGDSFRPKDRLTRREAIVAAYRLYGAW